MTAEETYRPAFTDPPGKNLAGIPISELDLPTPYLSYGLPFDEACAKHVRETFQASRVYVVASRSLAANTDKVDRLVAALGTDRVVGVRKGITPHTPWSEILQIAAECRAAGANCVVTLGAGSVTDGAKLVVLCLANDIRDPERLARFSVESTDVPNLIRPPEVPLITIPTSLSGGEYFSLAGDLCQTTPEYHWLSTGIRGVDHCVEAMCSLNATVESDGKAEQGLRLLIPGLLRCKADPTDIAARRQCQLATPLGMGSVRAGITMGGSHAIGHQLGPLGVPHGASIVTVDAG
ncbi:hypothetical protein LTR53_004857 [Teratosphaeriaceae sp. CCFEE 6253]|nr:hypothetical protein LTR53_004857 [Teratosphaeriaceae sp. CCFEE 6253]